MASGIAGVRGFVDQAVSVSPEASLAWAGVCIVLPLLTNIQDASDARKDGFLYVTERLRYYLAFEKKFKPELSPGERRDEWNELMESLNESLLALLKELLGFQIKAVIQLYNPSLSRDAFRPEDWAAMRTRISQLEHTFDQNSRQVDRKSQNKSLHKIKTALQDTNDSLADLLNLSLQSFEVQKKNLETNEQNLQLSHEMLNRMPGPEAEEQECHILFRLSTESGSDSYEGSKDRISRPVNGTCEWFLTHTSYKEWLSGSSFPLVVTGGPGYGKSVLAKHLVDSHLREKDPKGAICYFFFDSQTRSTLRHVLCALIHQLVSQRFHAIKHAMVDWKLNKKHLVNIESRLSKIFGDMVSDPSTGPVILVLDAVDEYAKEKSTALIKYFLDLHSNIESDRRQRQGEERLYQFTFLATTRPYLHIMSPFNPLMEKNPGAHISADDSTDSISAEIDMFVEARAAELQSEGRLDNDTRSYLVAQLQKTEQRTYLWVQLTLDYLTMHEIDIDYQEIDKIIDSPSKTVYERYRKLINISQNKTFARRVFSIMLAAFRTLTIKEIYLAMKLIESPSTEPGAYRPRFETYLPNWCGLLVEIKANKVVFINSTAREFLLEEGIPSDGKAESKPITEMESQGALAQVCLNYIEVVILPLVDQPWKRKQAKLTDTVSFEKEDPFLDYVSNYWFCHIQRAELDGDKSLSRIFRRLCDPHDELSKVWTKAYVHPAEMPITLHPVNTLWMASFTGMTALVEDIIASGDVEDCQNLDGQNTLIIAALQGHHRILELLLKSDRIRKDLRDSSRRGALQAAVISGNGAAVKVLLESNGIDLNTWDLNGETPIGWAFGSLSTDIIKAFFDSKSKDAFNARDFRGKTALMIACEYELNSVFQQLVSSGFCELNAQDYQQRTALVYSIILRNEVCAQALLEVSGTDATIPDQNGNTPLTLAIKIGCDIILQQLIHYHKVDTSAANESGRTALHEAVRIGRKSGVEILLGSLTNAKDKDVQDLHGWTPLMIATFNGSLDLVQQLLETKAVDVNLRNENGTTALFIATNRGDLEVIRALLEASASSDIPDNDGCTPLMISAFRGDLEICKLLLQSSDVRAVDNEGRDAMWYAELRNHTAVVNLFQNQFGIKKGDLASSTSEANT